MIAEKSVLKCLAWYAERGIEWQTLPMIAKWLELPECEIEGLESVLKKCPLVLESGGTFRLCILDFEEVAKSPLNRNHLSRAEIMERYAENADLLYALKWGE